MVVYDSNVHVCICTNETFSSREKLYNIMIVAKLQDYIFSSLEKKENSPYFSFLCKHNLGIKMLRFHKL